MRVLHLSTSSTGGAGVAAARIASAQLKSGMECRLITRDSKNRGFRRRVDRNVGKIVTVASRLLSEKQYDFISPISISTIDLTQIEVFKPDVVNIHNWFNLVSLKSIVDISKKFPVVFTLHDARLATGGCHVTLGCKQFESMCERCPASKIDSVVKYSKLKMDESLLKIEKYGLVFPSQWLHDEMEHSSILKNSHITKVIYNPMIIESDALDKKEFGATLKMCFISATLESSFKGLNMLKEALVNFSRSNAHLNIVVYLVGSTDKSHDGVIGNITFQTKGSLNSSDLKQLVKTVDFVLVPSQSDNFPNVITEAQIEGTLVIATNVGGIPEMIVDEVSGFLSANNAIDFAKTIERAVLSRNHSELRARAKKEASRRCSEVIAAQQYKDVYERLLLA
jgi:glycosyltransferase involved in cell wall biosynthesis